MLMHVFLYSLTERDHAQSAAALKYSLLKSLLEEEMP